MEWIIAGLLVVAGLSLMPWLLRHAKGSIRKGRGGGVVMALGMAFASVFDPPKAAAVEQIRDDADKAGEEDDAAAPPKGD